jgi:hypothetical protein
MRLSSFSPVERSNATVIWKAVDLQRPISKNNDTPKQKVVRLQRPVNLAHILLLAVCPSFPF